jgi:hypothetical protein
VITNKELLKYCLENPSPLLDDNFRVDRELVIIPRTSLEDNSLTIASKKLIDLFTTMSTLNIENDYSKDEILAQKILEILKTTENIHFFPFNFYCQTQGVTKDNFFTLDFEKQLQLIKDYIDDRHNMYMDHGYTNTILQTMCDSYAHKRNGDTGTRKLRKQVENLGIRHVDFGDDNYYLSPDKGDLSKFKSILNAANIGYKYYRKHNSKMPDLFLKINNNYVIVEHKHMTLGGGHQNSVIVDIMDFINEEDTNVYYVSYIDGPVFQEYFGLEYNKNGDNKYDLTNDNINRIFEEKEKSYILNAAGFDLFLKELLKLN